MDCTKPSFSVFHLSAKMLPLPQKFLSTITSTPVGPGVEGLTFPLQSPVPSFHLLMPITAWPTLHAQTFSHKLPVPRAPLPAPQSPASVLGVRIGIPRGNRLSSPAPGSPQHLGGGSGAGAAISCFLSSSWLSLVRWARRKLKVSFAPFNSRRCSHRPRCSLQSTCLLL